MSGNEYQLLDTGHLRRLEQVGKYRVIRPSLNAFWRPSLPESEWKNACAEFVRNPQSGGGRWHQLGSQPLPRSWNASLNGFQLQVKPTNFGHLGVFPEHASLWPWLEKIIPTQGVSPHILNLFAYTGALSLFLAKNGAKVTHCDAAQGIVDWAKENLQLNTAIPPAIRWMVDDAFRFVAREARRESRYSGIILDPPSFGRGAQGQVWKIEDQLPELLASCKQILNANGPRFLILTCHTPGFTPVILERILQDTFSTKNVTIDSGELCVPQSNQARLPSGSFARILIS